MLLRKLLVLLLISTFAVEVEAQLYPNIYRAPDQNWRVLENPLFQIVYPEAAREEALRTAKILERHYSSIKSLTGGTLRRFPILLNGENDLSNGFVSSLNFRSEIEIAPMRSRTMNPATGGWLDIVVPHELVHALHLNSKPPRSLTSLAGLFSTDLRRSIHQAAPSGFLEGIAVIHESREEGGGRGEYPWFINRLYRNVETESPWSLGQLLQTSTYTHPGDRHYLGGHTFFHWLLGEYGEKTAKELIKAHYRHPWFGLGVALRRVTGEWPGSLHRQFMMEIKQRAQNQRESFNSGLTTPGSEIPLPYNGPMVYRPLWMDENTILFYGRFYNAPTGFHITELKNGNTELLLEAMSADGYRFQYLRGSNTLLYSGYSHHPLYDRTYVADLYRFKPGSNRAERLTSGARLFSPSGVEPTLALQTHGSRNRLVETDPENGEILWTLAVSDSFHVREIAQHQEVDSLYAFILQHGKMSGIWVETDPKQLSVSANRPPDIHFNSGSLFDISWHPLEKRLLFTSDRGGSLDLYEFQYDEQRLYQRTKTVDNLADPSWSPDGSRIVMVRQTDRDQRLHLIEQNELQNMELSKEKWGGSAPFPDRNEDADGVLTNSISDFTDPELEESWSDRPWRTGSSWLQPQIRFPTLNRHPEGTNEWGFALSGSDLLASNTWHFESSWLEKRAWFNLGYRWSGRWPGFAIHLFRQPDYIYLRNQNIADPLPKQFLRENRGVRIQIPLTYRIEQTVRQSRISLTPEYRWITYRLYETEGDRTGLDRFGPRHSLILTSRLHWKIRQAMRDLQPNAGWSFYSQIRYDLNRLPIEFEHNGNSFRGQVPERFGFRTGFSVWTAPLSRYNQSLRLGAEWIRQSDSPPFDIRPLINSSFREHPFPGSGNLLLLGSRYTVPLVWPDQGGVVVPLYLESIYLVFWSQTLSNLEESSFRDLPKHSKTSLGAGLRARFRLSNLSLDIGIGAAIELPGSGWSLQWGHF
ncbi:MAG: hypothetical protein WDZ29_02515 [Balneolaceae bacterium]